MTITTALLLTLLSSGTPQSPVSTPTTTNQATAAAAVQQPRYDAPTDAPDGAASSADVLVHRAEPVRERSLDGRHRIEVRFGGWGDGWYEGNHRDWTFSGSARGAFGVEYLSFLRNDIGIGVGVSGLVRADDCFGCASDQDSARAVTSIPVVVRWYPVRRLTRARVVEPYVTAGAGPVFGVDTIYTHDGDGRWDRDHYESTRVGTTFGGRVGGGLDFRLGRLFTLGVAGAWNWDAGFADDQWRAPRPKGGEFTVALGWNFGR
jgi:hypothetical protein